MEQRVSHFDVALEGMAMMLEMEKSTKMTEIDHGLQELIKIRKFPLNGCAYCLDMHTDNARKHGET